MNYDCLFILHSNKDFQHIFCTGCSSRLPGISAKVWLNKKVTRFSFADDEGTKCVKQMINLFTITGQFITQNRHRSNPLRNQMLNNMDGQQMLIASLASSNGFILHQNNNETKV